MNRRPGFLPPLWFAMVCCGAGIYGMNLVYTSLQNGGVWRAVLGAFMLVIAVVVTGTPLAYARLLKKQMRKSEVSVFHKKQ